MTASLRLRNQPWRPRMLRGRLGYLAKYAMQGARQALNVLGGNYVATIGVDSSHTPCDGKRRLRPIAPRRGDARQGQNSRGAETHRPLPGLPGALRSEAAYVGIQGRELSRRQGGRAGEVLQRPR